MVVVGVYIYSVGSFLELKTSQKIVGIVDAVQIFLTSRHVFNYPPGCATLQRRRQSPSYLRLAVALWHNV